MDFGFAKAYDSRAGPMVCSTCANVHPGPMYSHMTSEAIAAFCSTLVHDCSIRPRYTGHRHLRRWCLACLWPRMCFLMMPACRKPLGLEAPVMLLMTHRPSPGQPTAVRNMKACALQQDDATYGGTPDFSSTTQLNQRTTGPADDLESLGYTWLCILHDNDLPWNSQRDLDNPATPYTTSTVASCEQPTGSTRVMRCT